MTPKRTTAPVRPRTGVYCRISQDRTGKMAGIARQEPDCRGLAERLGWDVVEVYVDNDVSAYKTKRRPAYERMKADLVAGRIGAVVAWHPDRLYRRARELEDFVDLVGQVKAEVATVQAGSVDLATPNGRLVARIGASVAQHESEHKAERVKAWHRQRAEAGQPNGGLRPFGYKPDRVTIDKAEAKLIREAARRRLAGESYFQIVTDWNARGLRTVTGRQWTVTSLGGVLRGPRVAGLRQHDGVLHKAVWDPILTRDDWEAIGALRQGNGVRGRPGKFLLTGLVYCGGEHRDGAPCGARMQTSHAGMRANGKKLRTWACGGAQTHWRGCGRVAAHAEKVEELVAAGVRRAIIEAGGLGAALARREEQLQDGNLLEEMKAVDAKLARLLDMAEDGAIGKAEYKERRAQREAERTVIAVKMAELAGLAALRDVPADERLHAWWADPKTPVEKKREVIAALVERVVVHPAKVRGARVFDPDRVEVVPRKNLEES